MNKTLFNKTVMQNTLIRYLKATKEEKGRILDELELQTGYNRKSVIRSLRNKQIRPYAKRGGSRPIYHTSTKEILELVWESVDYICAERFHLSLKEIVEELGENGYFKEYSQTAIVQVKEIPLGTLKNKLRGLSRPTASISKNSRQSDVKRQIPINTKQGKANVSGHMEVDFVEHEGGNQSGRYGRTMSTTDVKTQWHIKRAILGRDGEAVQQAMDYSVSKLPFKMRSLHSDNEPALLKATLRSHKKYAALVQISRTRPYKSNDNGHVEQKNGDKIRNLVGYFRYDTQEAIDLLNQIYEIDNIFQNHFVPSMRLKKKEYDQMGKLVRKTYDEAKAPYQRVLEENNVASSIKAGLRAFHSKLDRLELKRKRDKLVRKLRDVR